MNIAIIGGGISGITAAWYLQKTHQVTLFEAGEYLGGHTDTHQITLAGKTWPVDSGFIVFNEYNYPNFTQLLKNWQVDSQDTEMSFSVDNAMTGLQYNATNLQTLFCQKRNLFSPRFYRMLFDIVRFYRQAPKLLASENTINLGDYLKQHHYSQVFINDHLFPMACALWSGSVKDLYQMPAKYLVAFMHNHKMLSLTSRPQWKVVKGGSQSYVKRFQQLFSGQIALNSPVSRVKRFADGVSLSVHQQEHQFDAVIFACHADQALSLLDDATPTEQTVLGNIRYQTNHMQLHTDESVLPSRKAAWASWNVHINPQLQDRCTVSYSMNLLQNLDAPVQFITSLNSADHINADKVLVERHYQHPVYTQATIEAQQRWTEISGQQRSYFCGAYWGWGFHEDGVSSGLRVVSQLTDEKNV